MINLTKAAKLLSKSNPAYWYRTETADYLLTEYWEFKTNKNLIKEKTIANALFKMFNRIPEIDSGVKLSTIGISELGPENLKWMQGTLEAGTGLDDLTLTGLALTDVTVDGKIIDVSILQGPNYYVAVNRSFLYLIESDSNKIKLRSRGNHKPIFATTDEETLLLLPCRVRIPEALKPIEKEK